MNNKERMKKLFNKAYVQAILKRDYVKQPYIVLDNVLYNQGMESYTEGAKNRIFDLEESDYLFEHEHLQIRSSDGCMWLDEMAMIDCKEIILGYIEESYYKSVCKLLLEQSKLVDIENMSIDLYRDQKLGKLLKGLLVHLRMKSKTDEEKIMIQGICRSYLLELASRSWLVKLYWKFFYASTNITAHIIASRFIAMSQ